MFFTLIIKLFVSENRTKLKCMIILENKIIKMDLRKLKKNSKVWIGVIKNEKKFFKSCERYLSARKK